MRIFGGEQDLRCGFFYRYAVTTIGPLSKVDQFASLTAKGTIGIDVAVEAGFRAAAWAGHDGLALVHVIQQKVSLNSTSCGYSEDFPA